MAIDANGNQVVYTLEMMADPAMRETYFDLYKEIHGIKPRWNFTEEQMLWLFNNYDQLFEEEQENERRALAAKSEKHGIEFKSWSEYYDFKDRTAYERWQAEEAVRQQAAAEKAEFFRRGSPKPFIEAWEHGAI